MKNCTIIFGLFLAVLFASNAFSQDQMIYPKEGQDEEQMRQDRFECHTWAVEQSGFDPMQAQTAPKSQQETSSAGKSAVKGGAAGAALGAGIGAIAGDTGKGAAIGALTGGAAGGVRGSEQQRQDREQQAQETAQSEEKQGAYNRAFEACMEGRGYTVK